MSLIPMTPQQTPSAISAILFDKDGTLMDFQGSWGPWAQGVILEICGGPGEKAEAWRWRWDLTWHRCGFTPTVR
ncbi:hypothetical protein [Roseobacter sp. TSBP12]|uniref:hypothetical protein n=1 Tax=Roseobacter sp. TSBP12 TaxID=1236613 RepID=UPI00125F9B54|nr:hypothetical protein [Roseobacter sp. TSBP12]